MGFLDWWRGRRQARVEPPKPAAPAPAASAANDAPEPLTDDAIAAALARAAAEGYRTDDEIVEALTEELVDEYGADADVPARVQRAAPRVFEARLAEEQAWPVPTDCDRLDRAFERLEQAGIVARQDFTCCQNCGHAEIGDEIEQARTRGPVRGYTFFHHQDTERAAEGGSLYLAYGAVLPKESSEEAWQQGQLVIAHEVVAALQAEGLATSWNGQGNQRIAVGLDWRRRRSRT